jgi:hypothetical protein
MQGKRVLDEMVGVVVPPTSIPTIMDENFLNGVMAKWIVYGEAFEIGRSVGGIMQVLVALFGGPVLRAFDP